MLAAAITDRPYDPMADAISRLAEVGTDTRAVMTAGMVGLGLGLPLYGIVLRRTLTGRAWIAATVSGLATIGVALTPLGHSGQVDVRHAAFAGVGYVAVAATPLLAARPLAASGHRALATAGVLAGAVAATSLVLASTPLPTGVFQRLGLTAAHLWIATSATAIVSGRLRGP